MTDDPKASDYADDPIPDETGVTPEAPEDDPELVDITTDTDEADAVASGLDEVPDIRETPVEDDPTVDHTAVTEEGT